VAICITVLTLALELQVDVNAKNHKLHAKVLSGGGNCKFIAASALHGCYCLLNNCHGHQGGYGCFECIRKAANDETPVNQGNGVCGFDFVVCNCDCWCLFMEHNQQKIATGVVWEKKRLEGAKKSGRSGGSGGGGALPEAMGRTAWTEYIMSGIENQNEQEHWHVDGRSQDELLQDIATLAGINVFLDPMMVLDANVSWGLQKMIPLLQTVNYCVVDGTTRPMTLARVVAAKKRRGEVVSIVDSTPSAANFLRNSNTSNCVHQNHLIVPPAAAAAAAWTATNALPVAPVPVSTMVKGVMKRAGDIAFSRAALPGMKRSPGKVRAQLSRADPAYTSIVEDHEKEKSSQELFQSAWCRCHWNNLSLLHLSCHQYFLWIIMLL
jgi:hypothetical protein